MVNKYWLLLSSQHWEVDILHKIKLRPVSITLPRETCSKCWVERVSVWPLPPPSETGSGKTLPSTPVCLSNSDSTILHQKVQWRPRKGHFPFLLIPLVHRNVLYFLHLGLILWGFLLSFGSPVFLSVVYVTNIFYIVEINNLEISSKDRYLFSR